MNPINETMIQPQTQAPLFGGIMHSTGGLSAILVTLSVVIAIESSHGQLRAPKTMMEFQNKEKLFATRRVCKQSTQIGPQRFSIG